MTVFIDLTGQTFSRLTVISRAENNRHNQVMWRCLCNCGKEIITSGQTMRSGDSKSCGCLHRELVKAMFTTHGMRNSSEYHVWCTMKQRCLNPKHVYYRNYGGRGIVVCNKWLQFENFIADMGRKPHKSDTLERLDNNKGYTPDNCIWASRVVQSHNTRAYKRNRHGISGVYKRRNGTWRVNISNNGLKFHLGTYKKFSGAVAARVAGENKYWSAC